MGVCIRAGVNAIPAKIKNNELVFTIDEKVYTIELDIPKVEFELQCNALWNENIFAYLTNETYGIILRFDKTITIFTLDGKFVCFTGRFELPPLFNQLDMYKGGSMRSDYTEEYKCVSLFRNSTDNGIVFTVGGTAIVGILSVKKNKPYLEDCLRYSNISMPILEVDENSRVWGVTPDGEKKYEVIFEYFRRDSSFRVIL